MYQRQWAGRPQQAPPRKKQLVTYCMQPLSEQAGYVGPRQDGHRFGVNRILRIPGPNNAGGDGGGGVGSSLISAGRDGIVRRWNVSSLLEEAADTAGAAAKQQPGGGRRRRRRQHQMGGTGDFAGLEHHDPDVDQEGSPACSSPCRCEAILASHTDWVTGLAAAEERILVSSSNDGTLKLWDLASTINDSGRTSGSITAGDMDVDGDDGGDRRAGGGGEMTNGGVSNNTNISRHHTSRADCDRHPVLRPGPLATVARHGDYIKCLTYAPEAGVLVSGGLDQRILVWDLQRMSSPLTTLRPQHSRDGNAAPSVGAGDNGSGGGTGNVQGSSEGFMGYEDGEAWLHLRDPSRVVLRPGLAAAGPNEWSELCRQNKGSVYCLDTSANASLVASGGTDRMIRLLDPRAGVGKASKVCKLDGHRDNVRCVRIDEGGSRVVSGSTDGTIRVWDVRQQNCLGVYELPGGAVWAMHPSPWDSDVYYSGGRGRRVYRTDFRTGESTLVCMTNAEILDMVMELGTEGGGQPQEPVMWLSSTEPEITLWGGAAGRGDALRSGKPQLRAVAAGAADRERAAAAAAAVVETGMAPPYDVDLEGRMSGGDEERECLLSAPVAVIPGQPGILRHVVLNNRRHVLTEDNASPPNVALWDVTKAKQVEVYPPGVSMEEKERALTEIITVRPWFSIDTHLGTPMVSLSENSAFDGELYAVDASGERQTLLERPPSQEQQQAQARPPAQASAPVEGGVPPDRGRASTATVTGGGGTDGGAEAGGHTTGGRAGEGGGRGARAAKARSVQDEVKVNLGEAVLRSLFGRWIEYQHRMKDARGGDLGYRYRRGLGSGGSQQRGGGGSGSNRHLDNGASYSSGESEDDDSEQEDRGSGDESRSAGSRRSSSSVGSGLGPADTSTGGEEGVGETHSTGGGQGGSGSLQGSHGLDLDFAGRGVGRGAGSRALGDDTLLWIMETELGGSCGIQRALLQTRVGDFDGTEGDDVIPEWVTACVLHGEFRAKEQSKVSFYLAPWMPPDASSLPPSSSSNSRGSGSGAQHPSSSSSSKRGSGVAGGGDGGRGGSGREGGAAGAPANLGPGCQRYTAPAQMLVSKIMTYVLTHGELRQHLDAPAGAAGDVEEEGSEDGEGDRALNLAPEEAVEVLCGDRVLEPHLYVGAIQQYIWDQNAGGTLFLSYRSPQRATTEG